MPSSIYIYSPSGVVIDKTAYRRGIGFLEKQLECTVIQDPTSLAKHQRFAGNDSERIRAIERAASSGADVCLISRGGYGITRILAELPLESIASSIRKGTSWVGFSDFTAVQLALLSRFSSHEVVTWAGPALCEGFGVQINPADSESGPDPIMVDCFQDLLLKQGEGTGWRTSAGSPSYADVQSATLWGGNLSILCALIGTPYFPSIEGVLFIEDVGEPPYRIERMLDQLLHCGILQKQKAILLGQFTGYRAAAHDRGYSLRTVIDRLRELLPHVPVVGNLPFGHVPTKVLLPVGADVQLLVEGRKAWLMWGHLGEDESEHDSPPQH